MTYRTTGRATPVETFIRVLFAGVAVSILLAAVVAMIAPVRVFAYTEEMSEMRVGGSPGIIVQNQSYSTSTKQNLFHSSTAANTEDGGFSLSGSTEKGIQLAQAMDDTFAGTDTGFFNSTASADVVPGVHIGNGFLGTRLGDPLMTAAPIYTGLTFPQMTRASQNVNVAQPAGAAAGGNAAAGNKTTRGNDTTTSNATGNNSQNARKDIAVFQPIFGNDLNDTFPDNTIANQSQVNTPTLDVTSNRSVANMPTVANTSNQSTVNIPTLTNASNQNATAGGQKQNASAPNATGQSPQPTPTPLIKPGQTFYHQQNKPFSADLTAPYGPFASTPAKVRNTSGFDRFLMNTVGRSTTDKGFNGTTSVPTDIRPGNALAIQIAYDFIQGGLGMTMPGTHLNYRAWPL